MLSGGGREKHQRIGSIFLAEEVGFFGGGGGGGVGGRGRGRYEEVCVVWGLGGGG